MAVSEGGGGGGDANEPVFFTNTSGNMFLQPPAGSALAGVDGAAAGNFATLDSDMGGGYPGSHQPGSGSLHHKSGDAKKVNGRRFFFFCARGTKYLPFL